MKASWFEIGLSSIDGDGDDMGKHTITRGRGSDGVCFEGRGVEEMRERPNDSMYAFNQRSRCLFG